MYRMTPSKATNAMAFAGKALRKQGTNPRLTHDQYDEPNLQCYVESDQLTNNPSTHYPDKRPSQRPSTADTSYPHPANRS